MHWSFYVLYSGFLVFVASVPSGPVERCSTFFPDVPIEAHILPSEIPNMSCKCSGVEADQACPHWAFESGEKNATAIKNQSVRADPYMCTSHLSFKLNTAVQWHSYTFIVKCSAARSQRTATLVVKKALNNYKCNNDEDCLFGNQRCATREPCKGKDCPKVCQCLEPTPVFVHDSPDSCYPEAEYGAPCNYTTQCRMGNHFGIRCSSDGGSGNETQLQGTCGCPAGHSFNGRQQNCLLIVILPPQKQTLTERVMIAVCCGIVGVFIFVFVSYICKRHIRHWHHRHNDEDRDVDPESSQSLTTKVNITDKPPSYQESQKAEIQINIPSRQTSSDGSNESTNQNAEPGNQTILVESSTNQTTDPIGLTSVLEEPSTNQTTDPIGLTSVLEEPSTNQTTNPISLSSPPEEPLTNQVTDQENSSLPLLELPTQPEVNQIEQGVDRKPSIETDF